MPFVSHLECALCGQQYDWEPLIYQCPACGEAGNLDVVYDYTALGAAIPRAALEANRTPGALNMWRYRDLLPLRDAASIPTLHVGWTPLIAAPRLAEKLGLGALWIKDEGRNPTASLKDRASAMVVARAREIGAPVITTASSGNAAAALSGVCASVGMRCVIFVPASAPQAKITQLLIYGATVFTVQGTYDDAFDLSVAAARRYGWYCRNTGMNPFTTEGKKTAALEIAEQLGWRAPDAVVISVGDGNIIAGQYKGFYDLHRLGWIDHLPRLIGVQAAGSAAMVHAWRDGLAPEQMTLQPAETVADSISVGLPRDRVKAMRAVKATQGVYIDVPDDETLAAIPELARAAGVFAEPAASITLPGLKRALAIGAVKPGESVVLLITGHGLKDIRSAIRSAETDARTSGIVPHPIPPDPAALDSAVKALGLA